MTKTVLLNNVDHPDLRIITRHGEEFGDSVNQVLILPTEFGEIQREYPIFLRKDANGEYQAVALLGLDRDENLFLEAGGWRARYVPAVQERGPFAIGFQDQEVEGEARREPVILIDLDHPRVSSGEGERVFLPHGGNSPYLEHIARILRVIHQGIEVSKPMYAALDECGLIEPVAVELKLNDREKYDFPNLYSVGADRLSRLDGASLEQLNRAGYLQAAYFIRSSLGNMARLIELKNRKRDAV
jgi:SapC